MKTTARTRARSRGSTLAVAVRNAPCNPVPKPSPAIAVPARYVRQQHPRDRVLAVFDGMGEAFADARYRGCPLARAAAERRPSDGVRTVCDVAHDWMRDLLAHLAREAGAARPDALARQLQMLYDGAAVSGQLNPDPAIARSARAAAALLLDATIDARRNAR